MTPELEAIFARPIAHRGYHDADNGVIENTPTAIQHAIDKNFAIEVDVPGNGGRRSSGVP